MLVDCRERTTRTPITTTHALNPPSGNCSVTRSPTTSFCDSSCDDRSSCFESLLVFFLWVPTVDSMRQSRSKEAHGNPVLKKWSDSYVFARYHHEIRVLKDQNIEKRHIFFKINSLLHGARGQTVVATRRNYVQGGKTTCKREKE